MNPPLKQRRLSNRRFEALNPTIISLVILLCLSAPAWGHAVLLESIPAHGATLKSPPQTVLLRFNTLLEQKVARVDLVNRNHDHIALKSLDVAQGNQILVRLPDLTPDIYTMTFRVLARDGHMTQGSIRFTILLP